LIPRRGSRYKSSWSKTAGASGFDLVRRAVLSLLDLAADRQCAIDSLPVPVVGFHLAPVCSREWVVNGASFGKVASKRQTIYGYKLHLLVTLGGVILDFELAPAHVLDLEVGCDLLSGHADLDVYGDKADKHSRKGRAKTRSKGYVGQAVKEGLEVENRIELHTVPRSDQEVQTPAAVRLLLNHVRQIVETVNSQLAGQFGVETNRAHTFLGLCTRLHSKLAAHTLCIYLNRLLGERDFLRIKRLAFNI